MEGLTALSVVLPLHHVAANALQVETQVETQATGVDTFSVGLLFFVILIVAIAVSASRGRFGRNTVQRPLSEATSFPPPPPPDTVMVKCQYCGAEQTWRENCAQCGAPMPKPKVG